MLNPTRWPFPRVLAHRGAGTLAPENTLVALRVAASCGCAGVEFDVRLAADDVPVLLHDATLDRTTDATGPVSHRDAATLARIDAGSWFGNEFVDTHVPTLAAAAALAKACGLWCNVELKCDGADAADRDRARHHGRVIAQAVDAAWRDASPAPLVSSFDEHALAAVADVAPDLPRGLLVAQLDGTTLRRAEALRCRAICAPATQIDAAFVDAAHAQALGVLAWTVNDAGLAITLFEHGVDAIVTDELREIPPDFIARYGL
ncbi:MAG: glycerophosphodiester phosphodiesterase [Burkholderiales bacterium]|nr:glycerophosphodiester phosphodiesterase [Burkholderiales bacterium]